MLIYQPYVDYVLLHVIRYAMTCPEFLRTPKPEFFHDHSFSFRCFNEACQIFPELNRDNKARGAKARIDYNISKARWAASYEEAVAVIIHDTEDNQNV